MWPFLDPIECRQAALYLAHGQPLEAARILLAAKAKEHKAVREGLLKVGPALIEQARQTLAAGELLVAEEMLTCAGQCVELPAEARKLYDQISRQLHERQQQHDWAQRRLAQADRWAHDGRLHSALGMIESLDNDPLAARRRLDWQQAVARLDRYAVEFRDHLSKAEFPAAAAVLRKARELAPDQPLVLCLQQELEAACPPAASLPPTPVMSPMTSRETEIPARPTIHPSARTARLLLTGLSNSGDVLVLPQSLITIGTPRDATVELPIQALLRRRHALLIREPAPGPKGQCHRLAPLAGAAVLVNGQRIANDETAWLKHDDLLQFGPDICRWLYRRPVADSPTAVLQQARPGGAAAVAPDGRSIARIVLLADELTVGRQARENHLVEAGFPVERLRLTVDDGGWRAAVKGGVLFVQNDDSEHPAQPLRLPAELMLYADGPELIGNALQGERGEYKRSLKLVNV